MREKLDIQALISDKIRDNKYHHLSFGDKAAKLPSGDTAVLFACPVCGETYKTHAEANHCRTQPYDTAGMKIGDIVVVPGMYHNVYVTPGDPWCAFVVPADPTSDSHFNYTDSNVPYFVVTAVHPQLDNPHRCLVTLVSVASDGDDRFLRIGWNPANGIGHYSMYRVRDKKRIRDPRWEADLQSLLDNCEPCAILKEEAAELAAIGISTRNLL